MTCNSDCSGAGSWVKLGAVQLHTEEGLPPNNLRQLFPLAALRGVSVTAHSAQAFPCPFPSNPALLLLLAAALRLPHMPHCYYLGFLLPDVYSAS